MPCSNVDSTAVCDEMLARAEAAGAAGPTDGSAPSIKGLSLADKALDDQDWLFSAWR